MCDVCGDPSCTKMHPSRPRVVSDDSEKPDPVNPSHYDGTACMEAIEAAGWGRAFCLASVLKYIWRSGRKDAAPDDLKKARWYLDRVIEKETP